MIAAVKRQWKEVYQHLDLKEDNEDTLNSPPCKKARQELDFLDRHLAKGASATIRASTEFDSYITSPAIELAGDDAVFL